MAGQHSVPAGSSYGKRSRFHMAYALFQSFLRRSMINRQADVDFRYLNIAHDPVCVEHVQIIVRQGVSAARHKRIVYRIASQVLIVLLSLRPLFAQFFIAQPADRLLICLDHPGLVFLRQIITDGRVEKYRSASQKQQQTKNRDCPGNLPGLCPSFVCFCPFRSFFRCYMLIRFHLFFLSFCVCAGLQIPERSRPVP